MVYAAVAEQTAPTAFFTQRNLASFSMLFQCRWSPRIDLGGLCCHCGKHLLSPAFCLRSVHAVVICRKGA